MAKESIVASIDVGTTKVCTILAKGSDVDNLQIIGMGVAPARGMRKGMVVNMDETMDSIRASVEKAERNCGVRLVSAFVGIAGSHINCQNNRGIVAITRSDHLVVAEDVSRVLDSAATISMPGNREVLHVIPRSYILDGQDGIRNPVGMYGYRLEAEVHIITAAVTSIQNLTKCVNGIGVEIEDLVSQPLASGEAVVLEEERDMGVVLMDMGGGTCDVSIFIDGSIYHTAILPVGGNNLTNDIAIGLRTPFATAEEIKIKHGHALYDAGGGEEGIQVAGFGGDGSYAVPRSRLNEIIRARMEEVFDMVQLETKRSGYDAMLPAGLVIAGGTANLKGMEDLGREALGLPVRVGVPRRLPGLMEGVNDPAYATGIGLLLWGMKHGGYGSRVRSNGHHLRSVGYGLLGWLKELFPS
ncbi:MAG: cell division protein FtsA [Chloroflexi bacterium]|nr:cell division protein FtsA [Chloroflexota bacterium]